MGHDRACGKRLAGGANRGLALVALNRFGAVPGRRTAALAAVVLAAGLLTKAYFLAFVPLLIGVCVWRMRWKDLAIASVILCGLAGPWYARNLVRYGVFTGTQESGPASACLMFCAPRQPCTGRL